MAVKKGSKKYKEILIYAKRVEIQTWKTIKEKWEIDEDGVDKGLREKAFKHWKTGFFSAKLHNFSLLHMNNRYKYDKQMCKYKKDSYNIAVSDKLTFCKIVVQNTTQIESREHIHLTCNISVKVLKETAEAIT